LKTLEEIYAIFYSPEFAEWAFGPEFREMNYRKMPEAWNLLHGKNLTIKSSDNMNDDIRKMLELYEAKNE
jgi:hypothetical protein